MQPAQLIPHRALPALLLMALSLALLSATQALAATETPAHLVVLQYHHVSTTTPASTSISPQQFTEHMDWLADNGYTVADLPAALALIQSGAALPDKTVAITFDDGYLDIYQTAFPLLRERGWPFTVFVNPAPHDAGQRGWASWEQLREMAAAGASIANHTTSHVFMIRRLANESTSAWLQRLRSEIENAEQRIEEETGQSHKLLAYPYGESDQQVRQLISDLGFIAFGQQSGSIASYSDFTDLPRFPLSGTYSAMVSFKTKMQSLPMVVTAATPLTRSGENLLDHDEDRPALKLQLAHPSQLILNCFASGQGAINVTYTGSGSYNIEAPEPLPIGLSRYNCTHAGNSAGRYHWYSYAWIRRNRDEQWSHQ